VWYNFLLGLIFPQFKSGSVLEVY